MSARAPSYLEYFEQATGRAPYAYQIALGEQTDLPSVLDVPTGAGKTQAIIVSWLYHRHVRREAPRRLVYALPMRALVEQTRDVVSATLDALGLQDDISVHVIQGGEPDTRSWRESPERDQILVGTIDLLLSRALGRGYGESRFAWPVSLGLLNNDCRWVFDEVQLMGPARATSAQLDGLRRELGTIGQVQTLWASATVDGEALRTIDRPNLGRVLRLPPVDLSGRLGQRLDAVKRLTRVECGEDPKAVARVVAEHHAPGERTIVVLNRVRRAQDLYRELLRSTDAEVVLVHSRFREPDRTEASRLALAEELPVAGRIVVATQVIEAGVDISASLLVTETAPWSSLVQRLGRCNRYGEHDAGRVLWLDGGEATPRLAPPYRIDDLGAARTELLALAEQNASLSPRAVGERTVAEHRDETAVLRRRDLLDLFDTAPDLSGLDIDVSPFVREADRHTVSVLFRALPADPGQALDEPRATRRELVDVPITELRRDRLRWVEDFEVGGWRRARPQEPLTPGSTVLLAAADGGYEPELGWTGKRGRAVPALVLEHSEEVESIAADPLSAGRSWVSLEEHLEAVRDQARRLGSELAPGFGDALTAAGGLHDLGKAHAAFQSMLQSSIPTDAERPEAGRLWAKSAHAGGRHERRFFRHELASALALLALDEPEAHYERRALVEYLVAAHHGRVRLSIRPAPGEDPEPDGRRQALGVREGDRLPEVRTPLGVLPPLALSLEAMELGGLDGDSWTARAAALRDDVALGPLRLAFLEALLRAADWRAS